MKKLIAVALAGASLFSLASCKKGDSDTIDAIILYKNNSGMTYRQDNQGVAPDGTILNKGDMLPMWVELEKKFNVKFNDVADYSQGSTKNAVTKYMQDGYKGVDGNPVEMIMTTNAQTAQMANQGKLIPLSDHLDKMPNFSAYLDTHPSIKAQLTQADGKIYNTPYFDGVDAIEQYFMMNPVYVRTLLDDEKPEGYQGKTLDTKTTINSAYTTFYDGKDGKDKMAGQKLTVVNKEQNGSYDFTVNPNSKYLSAIDAQNSKGVINGQSSVQALKEYIDDAYRYNDELKALYPNRSDVFLSASACYNVDDLVALFRAVKTNPQYLIGKDNINVFIPRSGEANRQKTVAALTSFFGVRGIFSETQAFYFDKNGELQDGRIQEDMYEAFQKLNEIYQEGLIIENYDKGFGGDPKNEFRKNLLPTGEAFCSYDFAGTTSPYAINQSSEYTVVLPPMADWDVEVGPDGEQLNDFFQFTEDCRALKDGGTVIPADCNPELLDSVLAIMDYMYTDEGADLQDYGPNTTAYRKEVTKYDENGKRIDPNPNDNGEDGVTVINGETSVVISDAVFKGMKDNNKMWNDYYRQYVGSTHGIGHIRSDGLDYQNMSDALKNGMARVSLASEFGSMYYAKTTSIGTFFTCAPSAFAITSAEEDLIKVNCKAIDDLWILDGGSHIYGPTQFIKDASKITDAAIAQILSQKNIENNEKYFLKAYRRAYNDSLELIK